MSLYRELFYSKGKNRYVRNFKETNPVDWPSAWKTTYYKEYSRFPSLKLVPPPAEGELLSLIKNRNSDRSFSGEPLTQEQLSQVLKYSCGEFEVEIPGGARKHRAQPSGGARYPIEMYVILFTDTENLKRGVYHYNVKEHSLEYTPYDEELSNDPSQLVIPRWARKSGAFLVMTSVFGRAEMKYQERGSWYAFIEAGHIAQNVHLLCNKLGLKSVSLGGVWDDNIEKLLNVNSKVEAPIYTVAIGK